MAKNDLLREYRKERKRVRDLVNRMKKRGYIDLDDVIPPIPKRITQGSIRRLKELTPRKLQEKARYVVPETGEVVSGRKGRLLERKRATEKAKETVKKKKEKEAAKKPAEEKTKKPAKPEKEKKTAAPGLPDEKEIIKKRIHDFIDQYNEDNPNATWEARQAFDSAAERAEAQDDGGQKFYETLKEREEELANEMDMWAQYKPNTEQYRAHKARFSQILQECLNAFDGSGEDWDDYDEDMDLPLW